MSPQTSRSTPGDPNAGVVYILQRTLPWVRSATIFGFLLAAVMIALALDAVAGGFPGPQFDRFLFLALYLIFAMAFMIPAIQLYKYGKRIVLFAAQDHIVHLEAALEAQRKFWKSVVVMGLVAICGIGLLIVLLVR
jgi:hypothetical protein